LVLFTVYVSIADKVYGMIIRESQRGFFLFLLAMVVLGSFVASRGFIVFGKGIYLVSDPLHAFLETFGAVTALAMALLLLQLDKDKSREQREYFLLAMGFLTLGILDSFHAGSLVGRGSLLLRGLASICGSVWFALVWVPGSGRYLSEKKIIPWAVSSLSMVAGGLIPLFRESFPLMMQDNKLTPFAVTIYIISGVLLVLSASYFFLEFLRSSTIESYLFTCMFLLSGLPALLNIYSDFWTEDWWFWHIERSLAYAVVFYYMFRAYLKIRDELEKINESLERRIAERTEELSVEVAERKRYGVERDQVIVELQDAMARIHTLTGLLPTCASCKKIKDEEGHWIQMESYIQDRSSAKFSHGLCPDCVKSLYPDIYDEIYKNRSAPDSSG
jgi:hypothetical protein